MAWDPCCLCGQQYFGTAFYTYTTWFDGNVRFAFRIRHCGECRSQLRNIASEYGDRRNENGLWERSELAVVPEPIAPRSTSSRKAS